MEKLYVYVDETGQDTLGRFFIVVTIVLRKEREALALFLERAEKESRKGPLKWKKAKGYPGKLGEYVRLAFTQTNLQGKVFYRAMEGTTDFDHDLPRAVARAVEAYRGRHVAGDCRVVAIIDGLRKSEQNKMKWLLRRSGLQVEKARGMDDEGSPLLRLADMAAGMVREAMEGNRGWQEVVEDLKKQGILEEVPE